MLTKLTPTAKEFKALALASKLSGTTVKEVFKGAGEIHAEVAYREPNQLVKLGGYLSTLTDEEIAAYEKTVKEKATKNVK